MSVAHKKRLISPEEYLALERAAEYKSELIGGEMVAMSGASDKHEAVGSNLSGILFNELRGKPCRPRTTSNLRVRVRKSDFLYPDALVFCGKAEFADAEYLDTLLNPTVIFEILSPSTERHDRLDKSAWYEAIPSVKQYVYVSQDKVRVEVFTRQDDGDWLKHVEARLTRSVQLECIGVEIPLAVLYEQTGVAEEEA